MSTEEKIAALAKDLGDQLLDEAKEVASNITDEAKDFFQDVGKRMAKAYWKKKTGNDQEKAEAEESIEALNRAIGSRVANIGLDFVEQGQAMLAGIIKSVGKTLLTVALA